jgi:hypothetical protein
MNTTVELDQTTKTEAARTVPALLAQLGIHAGGGDKAMDTEKRKAGDEIRNPALLNKLNDYDDVTEKVVCKLTALTEIFEFFQYANGLTDFRKKSIPGICYIIDDCVDDLEGVKK